MKIADATEGQRRRLEEIKRQRNFATDHALLVAALVALTGGPEKDQDRSEEHTSELQSP